MREHEAIHADIDERGVATVTIDRPEKRNALDPRMIVALRHTVERVAEARQVRVIVLTGAGAAFCAGMDVGADAACSEEELITSVAELIASVDQAGVPTIARVAGPAMGGGLGLAAVCDVVVASTDARFGIPELRLGLAPAVVSLYAARRLGRSVVRSWALTAEHVPAAEAHRVGLVDVLCAPGELDDKIGSLVDAILRTAPQAARTVKRFLAAQGGPSGDDIRSAVRMSSAVTAGAEAGLGMTAFRSKQPPPWVPRE
ncbi:enoyl-CoA hydratase/isomerase family protein [Microtetraspora malaysiensis]|uniref:enoyl-CoA hydratase/isomerase family protein n=1 Tax=Microtetraspora malaysiensis TaxID=161358 RepID=UPI003D93DBE6